MRDRNTSRVRRTILAGALSGALVLIFAASALAASKTINVGTPFETLGPAITVTDGGDAVIAWANTKDLPPTNVDVVQYCVVPPNATGCSQKGTLVPGDSASHIDKVQVLHTPSELIVLADVYGAAGNQAGDYTPEQEWISTDGGATFTLVDGGLSVASGIINADTQPLSAVIVPGTGVLGYGWDTAGGSPPTFNAFPLSSPPECSVARCGTGYASLSPSTNPDQLGSQGGQFVSEGGAHPGVMGVFNTLFTNGPLGCAKDFGTAFAYGSGSQSSGNDYNISPGSANSAWKVPVSQLDCDTEYPALGGGASGFGVLEDNLGTGQTVYHRFDPSAMRFDTKPVVVASDGEQQAAVSQDFEGDVFATYLLGGVGGPVTLSYSADGGSTWTSGPLDTNSSGGIADLNSAVSAQGQGWATWDDNGSVFAQSFQASDAVKPATVGGGATTTGKTVTLDVSCASFPCTITVTLTAPQTVVIHAASTRSLQQKGKRKRKARTLTLGSGKLTIRSKGTRHLTFKLSRSASKLLRSKHGGHFKVTAKISTAIQHRITRTERTLNLRIVKPNKSHKK